MHCHKPLICYTDYRKAFDMSETKNSIRDFEVCHNFILLVSVKVFCENKVRLIYEIYSLYYSTLLLDQFNQH